MQFTKLVVSVSNRKAAPGVRKRYTISISILSGDSTGVYSQDFSHDGQALDRCNPTEWFQAKNDNSWSVSCTQFENTSSPTINMVQTDPLGDQGVGYQMRPQRIAIKTGPRKIIIPEQPFQHRALIILHLKSQISLSTFKFSLDESRVIR